MISATNTVLYTTGPGKWELQVHKQSRSSKCKVTSTLKAILMATHMAFVKPQQVSVFTCSIMSLTYCVY